MSSTPVVYSIRVQPAWYATNWGIVALFVGSIIAFYRLRIHMVASSIRARYDERVRMARDVHDSLLQTVQGTRLIAQTVLSYPKGPKEDHGALEAIVVALDRAFVEGRMTLQSLPRQLFDGNDLVLTIQKAVTEADTPSAITVDFRFPVTVRPYPISWRHKPTPSA